MRGQSGASDSAAAWGHGAGRRLSLDGDTAPGAAGQASGQHSMTLTARPPRAVSLYFTFMSRPVSRMVLIDLVERDDVRAVAAQRRARGGDRLDGRDGVALDAGDLHEAADRVAGQAEVVLHADLGGVLDLLGRAAEHRGHGAGRHRARRADLALAADLGARDRRGLLVDDADGAGGEQEADDAVAVGAAHEVRVVVQHGRDDARRTVRRGGDDASTGGVLLVDGQGVEGDPVHAPQRVVAGRLELQASGQLGRPAAHAQAAGQHALGGDAVAHALLHDLPDLEQALADLLLGAPRQLVLEHDPGDRLAGLLAVGEQLVAGAEGVRHGRRVLDDPRLPVGVLTDDEAAPHGVVGVLRHGRSGRRRAP